MLLKAFKVNFKLNKSKCEFGKKEIKILGHTISNKWIKVDVDRIKSIVDLLYSCNKKKLQSLLGLYNYCSKFIKDSYKFENWLYKIIRLKSEDERRF